MVVLYININELLLVCHNEEQQVKLDDQKNLSCTGQTLRTYNLEGAELH